MPDSEGYLLDDEVLLNGEAWQVREPPCPLLCECYLNDETECPGAAAVELNHWGSEDCHSTLALCQACYDALLAREKQ